MLLDDLAILRHLRDTSERSPVRRLLVVEAYVDMRVVLQLVELVRCTVREEQEAQLCFRRR